jgi:hypothetical protein
MRLGGMAVKERMEAALGVRVVALASMPVGFGLAGYRCDLADGRRLAVKALEGSARADLEAYMLGELARQSTLPVPAVHVAAPDLLAMDFIETDGGGITPSVERHAAELIAALHATPRPFFGYERDTLIGLPDYLTEPRHPSLHCARAREPGCRVRRSGHLPWSPGDRTRLHHPIRDIRRHVLRNLRKATAARWRIPRH